MSMSSRPNKCLRPQIGSTCLNRHVGSLARRIPFPARAILINLVISGCGGRYDAGTEQNLISAPPLADAGQADPTVPCDLCADPDDPVCDGRYGRCEVGSTCELPSLLVHARCLPGHPTTSVLPADPVITVPPMPTPAPLPCWGPDWLNDALVSHVDACKASGGHCEQLDPDSLPVCLPRSI
jgi:hypothetical protein